MGAGNSPAARIRRYRERDLAAVYDVCVRTADGGGDARGKYQTDDLMPDLFAGPYVYLQPEFAFVLDDGERAVGYVIGTPDTVTFARAYRERWIPRLADRYPVPPAKPTTPDEQMLALHYSPERMIWPGLAEYPAHLHIDLLPPFQRAGYGRALMETFFEAAASAGAARVHLVVVAANTGALAFYDRLGFTQVPADDPGPVVYLGRPLTFTKPLPGKWSISRIAASLFEEREHRSGRGPIMLRAWTAILALTTALGGAATAAAIPASGAPPGNLYYVAGGYIVRAPAAGGAAQRVVHVGGVSVTGMAITDGRLYWTALDTGQLDYVTLGRGVGKAHTLVHGLSDPAGLASAGGWLYWADQNALGRVRPNGAALSRRFVRLPQQPGGGVADGLATDGRNLYFSRCQDDEIGRATLAGANASDRWLGIRSGQGPFNVAADNTSVYWDWGGVAGSPVHIGTATVSGTHLRTTFRLGQGAVLVTR